MFYVFSTYFLFNFSCPFHNNFTLVNQTLPKNEQIEEMFLILQFYLVSLLIPLSYQFYSSVSFVKVDWVIGFDSISKFVGFLIPNPVFIYIYIYIYRKVHEEIRIFWIYFVLIYVFYIYVCFQRTCVAQGLFNRVLNETWTQSCFQYK